MNHSANEGHTERSTRDVLDDHLSLRKQGDVERDITRNYAPDCVLMTSYGNFHGHDGVRESARLLARQTEHANYEYVREECHEELAFLEWTIDTPDISVPDGADSYWIRDGLIRAMTIHYSVHRKAAPR